MKVGFRGLSVSRSGWLGSRTYGPLQTSYPSRAMHSPCPEKLLRRRLALGLPDPTAEAYLYPTEDGGRKLPVRLGWGCPCSSKNKAPVEGWTGHPLLQGEMMPGERWTLGFAFLMGADATSALTAHDKFYLWEAGVIGEANIIR